MSELKAVQLELPLQPSGDGRGEGSAPSPADGRQERGRPLRRSPFEGHIPADRPTRAGQVGVHISVSTVHSVIQLATWPTGTEAWQAALTSALGEGVPLRVGDTQRMPTGLVMRLGPEELMIVSDEAVPASHESVAALRVSVRSDVGSVLDLSHARCRIHIEGEHAIDTLAKLFALDFRDGAFPINNVQLTSHHHVPSALHRTGETAFDAYVFTTYAREQLETLMDAALEFGVAVTAD